MVGSCSLVGTKVGGVIGVEPALSNPSGVGTSVGSVVGN